MLHLALAGALSLGSMSALPVQQVRNYAQVVCDDEPDPVKCTIIQNWYARAVTNEGSGCCGLGDAYWTDQIDKVTPTGVFVTVTDDRACKQFYEDEEGNYLPDQSQPCISKRDMNGKKLWVPNDRLDKKRQGNPMGHSVTFINTGGSAIIYGPDGVAYPSVYCAFLGFDG